MCEIYTRQPYPTMYQKLLLQADKEIHYGYHPALLPVSKNPRDYELIFVGTPNWYSTMAPPIAAYLSQNPLSGKKVIPFCTHGGGGSGHIEKDMRKICTDANMQEIFSIMGDGGPHLKNNISQWLYNIGIKD